MKIAIINPIMKTLNYPLEKEPNQKIGSDSQINIVELAKKISEKGNRVTVFASEAFKPKKTVSSKNFKIVYLPTRLKTFFSPAILPYCPTVGQQIKKESFDAIIATEDYQISTIQAALSKNKKTKLVIWQEIDKEFFPIFARLIQKVHHKILLPHIEKKIDLFIPRSTSAKRFLEKIIKNKKKISEPIPTPVNTSLFRNKKAHLTNFVLDVTRLSVDKNLEFLIKTAEITTKENKKMRFVVAGTGPKKEWLQTQIKNKKLEKNITITEKEKAEMPRLYNNSALTIIHTKGGIFPFAALESMACGKPVISSFKGALTDVIDNNKNGFFVCTPKEMAEKIVLLLKNKKMLARFEKNARKKAENFSMEKVAEKFIKTIEALQ